MTSTRLHISGHRFLRRRLESAVSGRDIDAVRGSRQSLIAGALVAIVLFAGSGVLAFLRPQPSLTNAPILMGKHSGALFVRLGNTLHPVLNLASARLITRTNADPQAVSESQLGESNLGPVVGIPGAPQFLGTPLGDDDSQWTVCDSRGRTTVIVGRAEGPRSHALAREQTLLVRPSGGSTYLLYSGRRALVDLRESAVVRALGIEGLVPLTVSSALLNLVPEAPPITAPRIGGAPRNRLPMSNFPDSASTFAEVEDGTLCVRWAHPTSGSVEITFSVGGLPIPAERDAVTLTQADGVGAAVDAVYLPAGRMAYVRATGLFGVGASAGTRYLISDTGVRFTVHDDDAAHDLGLPDTTIPAPWSVLATLPAGPELSRANASVAQDIPVRSP